MQLADLHGTACVRILVFGTVVHARAYKGGRISTPNFKAPAPFLRRAREREVSSAHAQQRLVQSGGCATAKELIGWNERLALRRRQKGNLDHERRCKASGQGMHV